MSFATPQDGIEIDATMRSPIQVVCSFCGVPGRRIVQAWRHRRFPEGIFSMAAVTLKPTPDGGTELVLVHRGVPKDLIPETEQAWRDEYWQRMKAYLARSPRSA
jgi:hypothetical protein